MNPNPLYNEVPGYIKNETWKTVAYHDEHNIKGFFGPYMFLSNMIPCLVEIYGYTFGSVENGYQAAKFIDNEQLFEKFLTCTPKESKKMANGYHKFVLSGWHDKKRDIMFKLCKQKFSDKNIEFKNLLLSTGNKYLEETNYWKDQFWGVYQGVGENQLGKILMEIRENLRNDKI